MSTLTDHAGFLLAIAADPVDRLARDAYLDWLTERDDPRAEFIRVQEELARLEDTENEFHHKGCVCIACRPVRSRSAKLLTTHERDWRGAMVCRTCGDCRHTGHACWPLVLACGRCSGRKWCHEGTDQTRTKCRGCDGTGYAIEVTFRRGFAHTVRAPLDVLLAPGVAEAIGRWHPVERVEVSDKKPFCDTYDVWWWLHESTMIGGDESKIPEDLFWQLPSQSRLSGDPSSELAVDALSAALLKRFRSQVTTQGEKTC